MSALSAGVLVLLQVVSKPQNLPYSRADLLRSFRMFAEPAAPQGCISPETLEKALVSGL
jgi:calmodulin